MKEKVHLLGALKRIVAAGKLQESGNLEHRLGQVAEDVRKELADSHYTEDKLKDEEIFALGLELGRKAENDIVYRVPVNMEFYYFIGTEADIIRKIEKASGDLVKDLEDGDVKIEV